MIQHSQIRGRRFGRLLAAFTAMALIGYLWISNNGNNDVSAQDIARQLQEVGVNCTPGELLKSDAGSAIREGLPCFDGDVMYEITTYPNQQATDEVTRFVTDNVGCQLAVSRSSTEFTLLIGAKFSIYVAAAMPTGIDNATKTVLVYKDNCKKAAI
jgi:hypothetical protein